MALMDIRVPDIGDFKDVAVIELLAQPGDAVKLEQSLITVESDKASMEIPSSAAGVLRELKVQLGDKVSQGTLIAVLEVASAGADAPASALAPAAPAAGAAAAPTAASATTASVVPSASTPVGTANLTSETAASPVQTAQAALDYVATHKPSALPLGLPHASPSIRRMARLLGVPLDEVRGSGEKGRIVEADLHAFSQAVMGGQTPTRAIAQVQAAALAAAVAAAPKGSGLGLDLLPWPQVDFAKFGPIERKALSRIKKISGANLLRNAVMIPAVTNHDDADITDLEAFRVSTNREIEKSGVKVTMLAFLVKACVAALKKFPEFNASLDGDELVLKNYWNIGFAADTPNGLMVPVIKNADQKGVLAISAEMSELAKKARDGKLSPAEMSGATFTISSLGGIGGRYFTPIINAPEVAILGVCKNYTAPVWNGQAFAPRLMLPLSLTWDHRVIDGAAAARFNVYLGQILSDFRRVIL